MNRRDFWAGLFVLVAGALLLGAYLFSSLRHFTRHTTKYIVEAREISGVSEGTEAVMGGYPLGRVRKVTVIPGPPLRFELEVALRRDVPIPSGTKVLLASKTLGGSRVLDFVPPEKPGADLPEGSHLTAVPEADLQQIYNSAKEAFDNFTVISGDLRKMMSADAGGDGVRGALQRLNKLLTDADATVRSANDMVRNLNQTVTVMRPQLESSANLLNSTMHSANEATAQFNAMMAKGGQLDELLRVATLRMEEMKKLAPLLEGYDPKKNPEIRETLRHLNSTMNNLDALTGELKRRPWLLIRKGKDVVEAPASAPGSVPASAPAICPASCSASSPASAPVSVPQ